MDLALVGNYATSTFLLCCRAGVRGDCGKESWPENNTSLLIIINCGQQEIHLHGYNAQ